VYAYLCSDSVLCLEKSCVCLHVHVSVLALVQEIRAFRSRPVFWRKRLLDRDAQKGQRRDNHVCRALLPQALNPEGGGRAVAESGEPDLGANLATGHLYLGILAACGTAWISNQI
jgi:hypothetical protein